MPSSRKRPRGRRPANLQITYAFDRRAYVRFRLRRWGEARLRGAAALLRRLTSSAGRAAAAIRRVGRVKHRAVVPGLGKRAVVLTPEAPK